jgi:hypothetical protein
LELPFNISLMQLSPERIAALRPVTVLDYFENVSGDFHEDGLFSVAIFGRVGDEARDRRFSFIDIKVEIFHPVIYDRLCQLRNLYRGIMAGTHYAIWDSELKDFVAADELTGETGYAFFVSHWRDIKFEKNRSDIRAQRIALIEKYRDRAMTSKILVMPAGMRDIEVDASGNMKEGDLNGIYRRILSIARTIAVTESNALAATLDTPRLMLQTAFNELYDAVEAMLTGKKGFIQNKWASRRVFDGTRNVITAMDNSTEELGAINAPKYTDTIVGLWQLSRALLPVTTHFLKSGYLAQVFGYGDGQARLVDPKTLTAEVVTVSTYYYDRWTTVEGLQKIVSGYGEASLRDKPVMIDGRYVALIYAGPDKTFRVFSDINELPDPETMRKWVRPINLVELIYLSGYRHWNDYVGFVTRYPVTGIGSCYPTTVYCKTTVVGEMRRELGEDWMPLGDEYVAPEFPTYAPLAYQDSLVIPSTRLAGLGADFDGDTASFNAVYTEEAVAEVKRYLSSKAAFVDPLKGLRAPVDISTITLVLRNMTGAPRANAP